MENYLVQLIGEKIFSEITRSVNADDLTEIRLRKGKPLAVKNLYARYILDYVVKEADVDFVVGRATDYSMYAHQEEICAGFLAYKGGIRIGVGGDGVTDSGKLISFKNITSLNVRIPKEVVGASAPLKKILTSFQNTLIVSPPFAGKTTLIRDMTRVLAENYDVSVIDERGELSGSGMFKLGRLSDVVCGVPKSIAYEGIIRALSPEIIVLDELFPRRDSEAVQVISASGIKLLASIHGECAEDIKRSAPELFSRFLNVVTLGYKPRVGSITSIRRTEDVR